MKARLFLAVVVCCGLVLVATAMLALAQEPLPESQMASFDALGTGFTYQGRLLLSGSPLSGTCDLQFTLWDAGTGGTRIGVTQTVTALGVSDGAFTVVLDFGAAPFGGEARWLEVSVRSPAGSGSYTTLSPRQAVTAVPYALYARNAWSLTGNAGTTPGTQFLGTTDNQALELKVNGARALRLEPNATSPNVIEGHSGNSVAAGAYAATIGGGGESGHPNRVLDSYGTVSGGYSNTASFLATIGGGFGNTAGPWRGTIAGGGGNTASGQDSAIGGGVWNTTSGQFAFIGGGTQNTAGDLLATVSGGGYNTAGDGATVGGGSTNIAGGDYSTIGGGFVNRASGWWATIGGGQYNAASGRLATIGGGDHITVTGKAAVVAGGANITVTSDYAAVGGGENISVTGKAGTVAGGSWIAAAGDYAAVGGGQYNTSGGYAATVGGGFANRASGIGATVGGGGGYYQRDLTQPEMPPGGLGNTAAGQWTTVGGGAGNSASVYGASVGGGGGVWYDRFGKATAVGNRAQGTWSTVGGGIANVASGLGATVAGGGLSDFNLGAYYFRLPLEQMGNKAQGGASTVSGGMNNRAAGTHATVAGGSANSADGYAAVVGGGGGFIEWGDPAQHAYLLQPLGNSATGDWATVPGGRENSAAGDFSFAAGHRATATEDGSFVWADSTDADFSSGAQNQFAVRATGGVSIEIGNGISLKISPNISATVGGLRIENLIGSSSAELAVVAGVRGGSLAGSGVSGNSTYGDGVTGSSGKAGGGSFTGLQYGVYGEADPWYPLYPGPWYGVWGKTTQDTWSDMLSMGVKGEGGIGVAGTGDAGVYGEGLTYGGYFTTSSGVGLFGGVTGSHFTGVGVRGESTSPAGTGVYGYASHPDYAGSAVKGVGDGYAYGVYGQSTSGTGGYFKSTSGVGLRADSTSGDLIEARIPGNRRFYVSNAGNVYADGTYSSPAADLAEMLPAADGLQPSDVLVMGTDGKLTRSSQPYQTTVVGVYSTQPAFLGGAGDDADLTGKVPLAVIGIVPVKVTTENGPILPGDALTTSSTPGHAMKAKAVTIDGMSFFPSGVIIGKALERLDQGTATIQMLVMLQ